MASVASSLMLRLVAAVELVAAAAFVVAVVELVEPVAELVLGAGIVAWLQLVVVVVVAAAAVAAAVAAAAAAAVGVVAQPAAVHSEDFAFAAAPSD